MKNDYYSGTYIPGIVKWGKITLLLGIFAGFLPALVMAFRGYMPPVSAIIAGTLMQISVSGAFYIVEPISYFPILGIPGTYLTFLSGNTSNMRVPCSSVAQEAAGVEMGTEEGGRLHYFHYRYCHIHSRQYRDSYRGSCCGKRYPEHSSCTCEGGA